jgi:nicotinic acid phosphoribosyltransferase
MEDIDIAEAIIQAHGEPFYRGGWEYIVKKHGGHLPVRIKAVPEGTVVPVKNVLLTIENTDPNCYWLTSFLETALLRAIWYPTTVASNSYNSKKLILNYLIRNGDPNLIDFKMQDFGFRGVSSYESAGIGGLAHLVNFKGTDTVAALLYGKEFYHEDMAGYSIPASEHSTITSWGKENEVEAYRNMLNLYARPGAIIACVSDSYDIYNACDKLWGEELKEQVIESGATLVVRPDCYDDQTQILTPSGWKYFSNLTENDLVAQVNDDMTYEFVKPLKIVNEQYEGDMYEIRDFHGKIDLLVTPNHRVVTIDRNDKIRIQEAQDYKPGNWAYRKLRSAKAKTSGKQLTWHERFLIALQADGCIKKASSMNYKIEFNFQKERKHNRLLNILNNLDYKFNVYYLTSRKGQSTITISVPIDNLVSKTFDWVDISNLDGNWCEQFIEELKHWDSSIRNDGRFKYDTTIKSNVDVVEYISISAGKGVLISVAEDNRKPHFSTVYTTHILDTPYAGGQSITKTKVNYKGTIHCVKVPSGMVLVKRNRGIAVSGNSGDPVEVNLKCAQILDNHFGSTMNSKGYKVLNHVRLIQGDGVNYETIDRVLHVLEANGYSSDNIAFGQGGGLLQHVNRDDFKFAMKCSSVNVNGTWRDVYKDPVTDPGKTSKKGRLQLIKNEQGEYQTVPERPWNKDELVTIYENGQLLVDYTLEHVRINASQCLHNFFAKAE